MTKEQALDLLFDKIKAQSAFDMAGSLIHWDAATSGVPEKSLSARGENVGWLDGENFRQFVAPDTLEAIKTLEALKSELDVNESAMIRELGRTYRKLKAVPPEEFQAFSALTAEAQIVWETAREKCDYEMMQPYYEKVFDYQRKLCDWYGYENHPYDVLLDDYEKGATVEMLDKFFKALRDGIVPLLKDIVSKNKQPKEISGTFDIEKQKNLMPWLTDFAGYDRERGKVGEVEHPFCTTINRNDVRITTKYHDNNLLSSIYSIIHECGHAIYEQNMDEGQERYDLAQCSSMGVHESQSRLYENMICRSRAFAGQLLPQLRKQFDYFKGWNEDMLYRAINIARPSLIRIEADELTYSLHVMVRYELEKALITGDIKVADLPGLWADKYEELIGIRPDDLAKGVLQDVHWGCGYVGYFPSYAVGTAYGAQMMSTIKKTVDIDAAIKKEDLSPITGWLKDNVHVHGALFTPEELLIKSTGEPFDPKYYVDYLKEKFTELYF
ncbi:MAG: carboxypeptidase M32 [Oscillospiraceae bacterium]|jgi:carboxypeptidase Taq|nr:carboxypeptidase M32 [Oscillospiraceae bacterium]